MTDNEVRATFLFYPPVDDADAWHMTFEGFEAALKQEFPGAFTRMMPDDDVRGGGYLSFEVVLAQEAVLRGLATLPFEECGCVTLTLASPSEAAVIAKWLRDVFIPSPELLRFSSEGALEIGDETHWELPTSGEADEIVEDLRSHIAGVEGF
ncbi:hypothetical protein ACGFWI_34485 [Streptomyces sp. NPDC048434]|uniref:hypothetical protein n=1 Tax=Streptomyces sp. NPDC048434 TaxID=3365549 RepID=UPI00371F9FD6